MGYLWMWSKMPHGSRLLIPTITEPANPLGMDWLCLSTIGICNNSALALGSGPPHYLEEGKAMGDPIGIGIIGLGESGQHHIAVIQGDRVRQQTPQPSEKPNLVRTGRALVRQLLRGSAPAESRPRDPGIQDFKIIAVSD